MGYLRAYDYQLLIQQSELNQMTTSTPAVLSMAESMALEEITSHLKQRYDVAKEFSPTTVWSPSVAYKVDDLVEINFPNYDATKTYAVGSLIIQAGKGYSCSTAITVPEAFTAGHWTLIGNQYDLFYAVTPKPVFDYKAYYNVNDQVFWNNQVYTCLIQTHIPDHFSEIQYPSYADIPLDNIFPDDPQNGVTYWGTGTPYSVPAGTLPTNATYWTLGDNRSQMCVFNAVHIALYNLSKRVAPANVPANRVTGYKEAVRWLFAVSQGDLNCEIPELQPNRGNPIVWGSQVRRNNQW